MFRRLKYWLLCWLLNDICDKSCCDGCSLDFPSWGKQGFLCRMGAVYEQAQKAWKIGGDKRG